MKKLVSLFLAICSIAPLMSMDISWGMPQALSSMGVNASDPRIVVDGSGNAVAVWVENGSILSSSQPVGGSWTALPNVTSSGTASTPKLGVDGSGNVTVAWLDGGVVFSSVLSFGGTSWTGTLSLPGSSGASSLQLGVDSAGDAVAVWLSSGFVQASTRLSGSWSMSVSTLSAASSSSPQIAVRSGIAVAVWNTIVSGLYVPYFSRATSLGTWSSAASMLIAAPAFNHQFPRVTLDSNGNATAVWYRYSLSGSAYTGVVLVAASLPIGSTAWSAIPTQISDIGLRNPADLVVRIGCDFNGNVIAVWTNSPDGESFNMESSVLPSGGTWSTFSLPGLSGIYSFSGDLAINTLNDVLSVFMGYDGVSTTIIQGQESDIAGPQFTVWTLPITISQSGFNGYPHVGFAVTGMGTTATGVAIWQNFNGSNNQVLVSTGTKTVVSPPSGVSASQMCFNHGIFTDCQNTITWTASSAPNLNQYNIYRNGVYMGAVDAMTFQFVDHNSAQNGTVVYGVSAFDQEGSQSDIVTYTIFP